MSENNGAKNEITMDDLARIVQDGFMEIKTEVKGIKSELKSEIAEVRTIVDEIKTNLNKKVDKVEYNTLDYRVERLEKKLA